MRNTRNSEKKVIPALSGIGIFLPISQLCQYGIRVIPVAMVADLSGNAKLR
jgi:hypothetical protein